VTAVAIAAMPPEKCPVCGRSSCSCRGKFSAPAGPIIKWVGGKTKLLPELAARVPSKMGRYFEPFAGGAALFFHLAPERAVLADVNPDLIAMYQAIAGHHSRIDSIVRSLRAYRRLHSEAYFYAVRDRWNDPKASWTTTQRAAAFIYLNKTCFNGLWRVNREGKFNSPSGHRDKPGIFVASDLYAAHEVLAHAELHCADYRVTVHDAERGDFVYFDPPYDPISNSENFTSYTSRGFTFGDQRELAGTCRELASRGVGFMLSNSDTPFVRELYRGFQIDRVMCARAINSKGSGRGKVGEVIVTGKPAPRRARKPS
jgi:DNA adenine methylase